MYPLLFQIGPLTVTSYFVFNVLAFGVAAFWAVRRVRTIGFSKKQIRLLGVVGLLSVVVGARVVYLFTHWDYYGVNRGEILDLAGGGVSLLGGLMFGFLAVTGVLIRFKLPVLKTLDVVIPPLVLGLVVARVGCFLEGCCYGMITELPWGVRYPEETVFRHPTQLYEAGVLLALLWGIGLLQRRQMPPGVLMLGSGFLYGLWRVSIGQLRADHWVLGRGINVYQWSGLFLVVITGVSLVLLKVRNSRN